MKKWLLIIREKSLTYNKLRVDQSGVAGQDATSAALDTGSTKSSVIYVNVSSGLTTNNSYHLVSTSSGSSGGYLRLDAEL